MAENSLRDDTIIDLDAERKKRRKRKAPRPKERITKDNWATLEPETPGKKDIIQCSHKHGFALVINPGGERSFAMIYVVESGEQRLRILGKCKLTPISAAYAKMDRLIKQAVSTGGDISRREELKAARGALRLRAAHAEFIKTFTHPQLDDPLTESSVKRYGYALQNLMEGFGGDVEFWDITRKHVTTAYDYLAEPEKKKRAIAEAPLVTRQHCLDYLASGALPPRDKPPQCRKGSLVTANYALHYLEILWAFHAKKFDDAKLCPVVAVEDRMVKTKSREGQILPEEFAAFWQVISSITLDKPGLTECGPIWSLYFTMMILTGRRTTELLKLKWEFVDLKRGTYTIVKGNAKNKKLVTFPMGRWLRAQLEKHRATQEDTTDWVWAYPEDTYLSGHRLDRPTNAVARIRKAPQFAKFQMHDARRTFGTITVAPAVETPLLTHHKLMNHHIKDQTGEYAKISADMMRPYVQRIENVMLALSKAKSKDAALDIITRKMEDR